MKSFSRGKGSGLFIVSLVLILFLLSFIVIAEPPSLKNQQFYGKVTWKATQNTPLNVIVKSGTQQWESPILRPSCNAQGNCEGNYGEDTSNILRVQPTTAGSLAFYIDTALVKSETYQPYKVTKVDLDISSLAPLPAPSTPQTQAPATTVPTTPTTSASTTTTSQTTITTPIKAVTKPACEYKWDCTQWSVCTNGMTTRSCSRTDTCDAQYAAGTVTLSVKAKPEELKVCQAPPTPSTGQALTPGSRGESCFDQIKNQDEEDVDCGGVCLDCPKSKMGVKGLINNFKNNLMVYIIAGAGILIVLGLVLGIYFWKREQVELPPETAQQLRAYFQSSIQEGQSKNEVVKHLINDAGWKKSIVKKFLKENKF